MIYIRYKEYCAILDYCKSQLPIEACGLLGGKKEEGNCYVEKVYFLSNVEKSRNHFSMIHREQFQAAKDMRRDGHELLGNFHSHPCGKPWPSREDKRLACDTNLIYFIISLMERENPQLKAYTYDQKKNAICEEFKVIK